MFEKLKIIDWPDPRLLKVSSPVETFDERLAALAARMFALMREHRGVGLAAPQVGENLRMFVMNHSGKPEDDRVYVNPALSDGLGEAESEEGCLSLPSINLPVLRSHHIRVTARDVTGQPIEQEAEGFVARIWQHETDHLNGTLIIDRTDEVGRMSCKKQLRELRKKWDEAH